MLGMGSTQRTAAFILGIALLLCLYVLSIGPAAYLAYTASISDDALSVAYYPVFWTADHTGAGDLLADYCIWWMGFADP